MSDSKVFIRITDGMSLKAYYYTMLNASTMFREETCEILGISLRTFFRKISENSWTTPERKLLSIHFDQSIEELFPEREESNV